jgi:hypothetical protein
MKRRWEAQTARCWVVAEIHVVRAKVMVGPPR